MLGRLILWTGLLTLWHLTSLHTGSLILPPPSEVAVVFLREIFTVSGMTAVAHTFMRFLSSYFVSIILGVLLGVLSFRSSRMKTFIWPLITICQATPVISWILLALLWFSSGYIPYFILLIFIVPIITINMYEGLNATDHKLIEMARVYRIPPRETFFRIYLPSSLPYLRAGMRIGVNASLKVLVTAEVIGRLPEGMGSSLNTAWLNIDTASLLGWTIFLVFLTALLEKTINYTINIIFRRYL